MVAEARQHSERMVVRGPRGGRPPRRHAKREYEASAGRAKTEADRLIENGNLAYEKAVQEGIKEQQRLVVADRDRADRNDGGDPSDRLGTRRGRPLARGVRHLCRQQARRIRGLPQRNRCGRWAAAGISSAPPRERTTTQPASRCGRRRRIDIYGDACELGGAPRVTVAARAQYLQAGPAARVDDDPLRDGAQSVAHRAGPDRDRRGRAAESGSADRIGLGGSAGQRDGVGADVGGVRALPHPDHRSTSRSISPSCSPIPTARPTRPPSRMKSAASLTTPSTSSSRSSTRSGLALPFSPLCGPDCAGLCPQCGVPLATAEPGHHHEQIDPRWAKLSGILDRDDK